MGQKNGMVHYQTINDLIAIYVLHSDIMKNWQKKQWTHYRALIPDIHNSFTFAVHRIKVRWSLKD
jgi:peroxiredoxin